MNKKRIALGFAAAAFGSALLVGIMILWAVLNLPRLGSLQDYSPNLVSKVLARDGRTIGEFYTERRYLVNMEDIPERVIYAFTSAEDDRFFEHPGIDIQGILRAALVNLKAGRVVQGGSTITQQVAKSLLLSPERSFGRKLKEVLLAYKIEKNLTKKQILYLYLNQIYLGQGAYGVEAASRTYFHKAAKDLTVAEAALLAGLVQAPSKYSPTRNPIRARERQQYVLRRMMETGHIDEATYEKSLKEEIKAYFDEDINLKVAPYYVEHVRQYLMNKYGQEKVYSSGLTVETAADYDLSVSAMKAVRANLLELDKRQGWRGPLDHFTDQKQIVEKLKEIRNEVIQKRFPFQMLPTSDLANVKHQESRWSEYTLERMKKDEDLSDERKLLQQGERYHAIVTRISPDDKAAELLIGTIKARLPVGNMRWAKKIKPPETANWASISRVSEALKPGDMVFVRVQSLDKGADTVTVSLDQDPLAEGALLSMESSTGYVVAMVGGYDFSRSEYNRALQGERQPGSSFKPFLYSSALDKGFTPSSIIVDSPIIFENQGGPNLKWIPENNSEKFYGDTTLRTAIINSRNVPAVKLLQEVQLPYFVKYLRGLGVSGVLNPDLSLALGSKTISLLELTKLYALFPRLGMRIEPVFVLKVSDRSGQVMEQYSFAEYQRQLAEKWLQQKEAAQAETAKTDEKPEEKKEDADPDQKDALTDAASTATASAKAQEPLDEATARMKRNDPPAFDDPLRAMDERTAFVMTNLLTEVVQYGTGMGARVLKRKVGGKTGTTNEFVDAWFMGFSPELVTGVWTGFDNPRSLGSGEVGSRAALPAWIEYMNTALQTYKQDEYTVPKGIVFVRIDPKSGNLAAPGSSSAVKEAYIEGTEPSAAKQNSQTPDSSDFFREDL